MGPFEAWMIPLGKRAYPEERWPGFEALQLSQFSFLHLNEIMVLGLILWRTFLVLWVFARPDANAMIYKSVNTEVFLK